MNKIEVVIQDSALRGEIGRVLQLLANPRPMMAGISVELLSLTEHGFQQEGPGWPQLRPATIKARQKQRKWPGKILQVSNALARSYIPRYGDDYAGIGSNSPYAAIHHFGGTIQREGKAGTVRLRTDAKGNLMRQGKHGKLAVFARKSHKRAAERAFEGKPYSITLPARPALPVGRDGALTPSALDAVIGVVRKALSG
jgi:phage virion morphogenesis protein